MAHQLEILAPAGDEAMLHAAVFSGANAVYLGLRGFNARRAAGNFGPEELAQAVAFCHARNCKVYAAVNTLALPGEEAALGQALHAAKAAGCDAAIVQDLATVILAKRTAPGLALHASTQMSVHSLAGVRQLAGWGFSRAILARELAEEEIAVIAAASPIELEVFVHGALCVSVSGQCMASAFLGGRSANRGACAGPCRLPFRAEAGASENGKKHLPAGDTYHLSLKDLSILDALPRLQAMGIAAAKIEGRLRGPEYTAVVVDAALKARDGAVYDKNLLQNVFSRSGFTDGWFAGKNGGEMFGVRTGADAKATKDALPKARELYRRERPRVAVRMVLRAGGEGGNFTVTDGTHVVQLTLEGPRAPAGQELSAQINAALQKTGGTPFYLEAPPLVETNGVYLSPAEAGRLRREGLEQLLALRSRLPAAPGANMAAAPRQSAARAVPARGGALRLRARFTGLAQMPPEAESLCDALILPLHEALLVPEGLRGKTWLSLPRALFGEDEKKAAEWVEKTRGLGFAGYEAQNIAHLQLCRGLPLCAGFGLNVTNALSVALVAEAGCGVITLSPELSLRQMRQIQQALFAEFGNQTAKKIYIDALCYGHLPLMMTRACPLRQLPGPQKCDKVGLLVDRMGEAFPMRCEGSVRSVHNPRMLWMADRLDALPTDFATLYFTMETVRQAGEVLRAFQAAEAAPGLFTRGLYDRGLAD